MKILSNKEYNTIERIQNNSARFNEGDLIFPYTYDDIYAIIEENLSKLKTDNAFRYSFVQSQGFIDFYYWYINKNELVIEPYIPPIGEIKTWKNNYNKFERIGKIIALSATLGEEERFSLEMGLDNKRLEIISEKEYEELGIEINTGKQLIFSLREADLCEVSPITNDFVAVSINYILRLVSQFNKVLILCWQMSEKSEIREAIKDLTDIYDFNGRNETVFEEFSNADKGVLLVANRYFGIDLAENACDICIITRLPSYLKPFDNILLEYKKDEYYHKQLFARRLIQAFGRVNRSENDISCVYILDPQLFNSYSTQDNLFKLFPSIYQKRIEFSFEISDKLDFEKTIEVAKDFLNNENSIHNKYDEFMRKDYEIDTPFGKESSILKAIYQDYLTGWKLIYQNRPKDGIDKFKNLIDMLAEKVSVKEFKMIIEWLNYIIYFVYFNLEKRGITTYKEAFKSQEVIIQKSDYLTWLNKVVYFERENIKKTGIEYETKEGIQLQFEEYSRNPELYLGKIANSSEVKSSLDAIKETLSGISQKHVKAPMRNLAVEFEGICKKVLGEREPDIVKSIPQKDYDLGTVLNTLNANKYLREETFQRLFDDDRGLRNTILHINHEEISFPESIQLCASLKKGTTELIFDVYFSDMLRDSKDLIAKFKKIPEFQYSNDDTIKNKILDGWSRGTYKFEPKTNTGEIFSYFGKLKLDSRGDQIDIEISLQH
ncbi:hypothetical protein LCGC14_1138330 [marine sediment metagenome]|uniref:ATP-dependent helicase C-terminal domain-containing protein n=1 Tax=marine sediment metagenome TaxID=412755 RepID=A0A0F9PH92_9ZZZZ